MLPIAHAQIRSLLISQPVRSRAATFTLGRARFAQISAVEGVVLTPEMREMMNQFDREGS